MCCVLGRSVVSDSVTSWTGACQTPLSMEFSRQEYWNGLPFPSSGDLPVLGIKPVSPTSPALAGGVFTTELSGKPLLKGKHSINICRRKKGGRVK